MLVSDTPVNAAPVSALKEAFIVQAGFCERLGSPFTARLMRSLHRILDRDTAVGRAVLDRLARPDADVAAVPLRIAAGLNALARDGAHPHLTAAWPPGPVPDAAVLDPLVAATLHAEQVTLLDWLAHAPQTNEVGRSAGLYAALMHVAARTALPLALFELGASAGLNLACAEYGYRLGDRACGSKNAGLVLASTWTGPAPAGTDPVIVSRRGCDLAPVDLSDAIARERLLCYVWPDQLERVERLSAALRIVRADPPMVDTADAADWIETRLPINHKPGTTRVLFHTIARQYFPAEVEARVAARIAACGAAASAKAPFAHVGFEQDGMRGPALEVTLWNGGSTDGTTVRLAQGQAHGATFDWYGVDLPGY